MVEKRNNKGKSGEQSFTISKSTFPLIRDFNSRKFLYRRKTRIELVLQKLLQSELKALSFHPVVVYREQEN